MEIFRFDIYILEWTAITVTEQRNQETCDKTRNIRSCGVQTILGADADPIQDSIGPGTL